MADEGGFRPYSSIASGGTGGSPTVAFKILNAESDNIFEGDLMSMEATGTVTACKAVTEVAAVGVFIGCEYTNSDGQRVWSNKYTDTISRDDTVAHILTDPNQLYVIKFSDSDVNTTLTQTAVGLNYDIEFNAGNTTTGKSGMTLDTGTAGATGAAQMKLVGLTNDDGTNPWVGSSSATYTHGIVQIDPQVSFWIASAGI